MVRESKTTCDAAEQEGFHGEPEALLGYRLWRVRSGQLQSLVNDTVWPQTHALEARCEMAAVRAALRLVFVVLVVGWIALLPLSARSWMVGDVSAYDYVVVRLGVDDGWATLIAAMLTVAAWLVIPFTPVLAAPMEAVIKRWVAMARRRCSGVVTPGSNTPGIFAMRRLEDVGGLMLPLSVGGEMQVVVGGSVWLWGDTIEHEEGVKGELAYPEIILEVACVRCGGGIPIGEYNERSGPPIHLSCPMSNSWLSRQGTWVLDVIFVRRVQRRWYPVGLVELQETAPQWFRAEAQEEM